MDTASEQTTKPAQTEPENAATDECSRCGASFPKNKTRDMLADEGWAEVSGKLLCPKCNEEMDSDEAQSGYAVLGGDPTETENCESNIEN